MFGGLNYRCMVTAMPTFLSGEEATGGELLTGGLLASFIILVGALGQYFGGWASDRFGAKRIYFFFIACLAMMALAVGGAGGGLAAVPFACLMSISLFAQQPVENSILAETTSVTRRSASYGTKFAVTFGIGALGAQIVGIIWSESGSLWPVFLLIAAFAAIMAFLVFLAVRAGRSTVSDAS